MFNFKDDIKKFDLYPFVTLATDASGSIVYKNIITKTIYPNIHIGAKLDSYADITPGATGVVHSKLYGEDTTLLIHKCDEKEPHSIIAVFSPTCAQFVLDKDTDIGYNAVIEALMNNEHHSDSHKQKHTLIRKISKSLEFAKACGRFARLYINNCNFDRSECVSASSFFNSLSNIMEKRMALGIKLEVVASNSDLTITIDKRSAIILLNLVCFSLTVSDDRNISISFNETGNSVRIGVSTRCDCVMSKMFDVENELPYIFTLLIGMNLAERREFEHTLSHNGKFVTSEVSVPLVNTSDAVLSSTGVSELLINEYFSLFTSVFNN